MTKDSEKVEKIAPIAKLESLDELDLVCSNSFRDYLLLYISFQRMLLIFY